MRNTGWRKSSFSAANGGCIEVNNLRKATRSSAIGIRDTKEAHFGDARTVLEVTPGTWRDFTARIREL